MRKTYVFFLIFTMIFCSFASVSLGETAEFDTVDVNISLDSDAFLLTLDVNGIYFIEENSVFLSGGTLKVTRNSDIELTVTHSKDGFLYKGKTISLIPKDTDIYSCGITLNGKLYPGSLILSADTSSFNIVNRVHISQYLYCVLPSSMPDSFPTEALKAQAVAAKSHALSVFKKEGSRYTVSDRESGLLYNGFNQNSKNVIYAVDATLGEALFFNSSILDSEYCISNGGETTLPENESRAYSVLVDDYDFVNPNSRIEKISFELGENKPIPKALSDMLMKKASSQLDSAISRIVAIYSVTPHSPNTSNAKRDYNLCRFNLRVESDEGKFFNIHLDVAFSYAFGFLNRYLTSYWGEVRDNTCTLYHTRQGSGVGLSMRGAQQRALSGHDYKKILSFYYPGASLGKVSIKKLTSPKTPTPSQRPQGLSAMATGDVYFRTGPSTKYDIIDVIKKDSPLTVYSSENGWAFAVYNSVAGYVSEKYIEYTGSAPTSAPTIKPTVSPTIKPTSTPTPTVKPTVKPTASPTVKPTPTPLIPPTETAEPIGWGSVSGDGVNFRMGPAVSYESIAKLDRGCTLTIYSKDGNFYYAYAPTLGKYGYISTSYVTFFPSALSTPSVTPTNSPQVTPSPTPTASAEKFEFAKGKVKEEVNFRTKPSSTNSTVIQKLEAGTQVNILGKSGSWYYVMVNDKTGFVSDDYITVESMGSYGINEVDSTLTLLATSTSAAVNMRHGPGTNTGIIKKLSAGDKVTVFLVKDGWCLIKQGSDYGFVSSDYVRLS